MIVLEHQAWKKVGLGPGYNDIHIDVEDKEDKGELDWKYDGFFGYGRYTF